MNLAEHPQALLIAKRISESDEGAVPAQVHLPGLPPLAGSVTQVENIPGLFNIKAPVNVKAQNGEATAGVMDFTFTADKPITVSWPDLAHVVEKNRIIS